MKRLAMAGGNLKAGSASKWSEEIQSSIVALIRLLYGLAIASGVKYASDRIAGMSLIDWKYVLLAVAGLIVGLSDWLMYHFVVSRTRYMTVKRLILDIAFPIGIFYFFYVAGNVFWFSTLLLIYFLCCFLYLVSVRKHLLPGTGRRLLQWSFSITLFALVAPILSNPHKGIPIDCYLFPVTLLLCSGIAWAAVNFWYVKRTFAYLKGKDEKSSLIRIRRFSK